MVRETLSTREPRQGLVRVGLGAEYGAAVQRILAESFGWPRRDRKHREGNGGGNAGSPLPPNTNTGGLDIVTDSGEGIITDSGTQITTDI